MATALRSLSRFARRPGAKIRKFMSRDQSLKVLLYGDFTPDRLAASYKRGFEEVGHRVLPFNTREMSAHLAPWLNHRIGHRLTLRSLALRRSGSQMWNRRFTETVENERPDVVFILNGEFLMPETLRRARRSGAKVFIFHADNPFPESSNNRPETMPSALECDAYFIWSRSLCARLQSAGTPEARRLDFAWDAEVFPYQEPTARPEHDVVFIGGWDREREEELAPLAQSCNLRIWGPNYWQTRAIPLLRRCWQGKALSGAEVSQVVARSKIVLNVLRRQNLPDGVNMRTFEVPGCGGFALSTRTSGALEVLPEGQAGAYFSGMDECRAQIESLLRHDQHRRDAARESHSIVSQHHRYTHRALAVISVYRELHERGLHELD